MVREIANGDVRQAVHLQGRVKGRNENCFVVLVLSGYLLVEG